MRIPVLYADERGPYAADARFSVWGQRRDARRYAGPLPVIAHPPCGHWGRYRSVCQQAGGDCGPIAFRQVREWGGVLEHPAASSLFIREGAPPPGPEWDFWKGRTVEIDLWDFGFPTRKLTWLYVVNVELPPLPLPRVESPTRQVESLSAQSRRRTPPALCDWLYAAVAATAVNGTRS